MAPFPTRRNATAGQRGPFTRALVREGRPLTLPQASLSLLQNLQRVSRAPSIFSVKRKIANCSADFGRKCIMAGIHQGRGVDHF